MTIFLSPFNGNKRTLLGMVSSGLLVVAFCLLLTLSSPYFPSAHPQAVTNLYMGLAVFCAFAGVQIMVYMNSVPELRFVRRVFTAVCILGLLSGVWLLVHVDWAVIFA